MTGVFKAITIASLALAAPAFAGGDADKGAKVFKKCKSCHMIQDDAGNNIVKGGKTGYFNLKKSILTRDRIG